jgi:predicted phosphodiesterase
VRYGIFSDVHSNLEALDAVIKAYKKERIDRYLCVGDVVGYASNPTECINIIKALAMVTVAGNHDWASVNLFPVDDFNPNALEAISWTRRNLGDSDRNFLESLKLVYNNEDLTLAHGTLDNPGDFNYMTDSAVAEESFKFLETEVCFVGHTHIAGAFIKDEFGNIDYRRDESINISPSNKYIVDVGSTGQPRDGNPQAAYCIYDTDKKEVLLKRIDYDIQAVRKKIIDAGLPRFLGDRLLAGR